MSQIQYTPVFTEQVKGQLRAQFRLDAQGAPLFKIVEVGNQPKKEYAINLSLSAPATASEIESVTYLMDDPTFWDPVAASDDRDNEFTAQISSYGDVRVKVTVRIRTDRGSAGTLPSTFLKGFFGGFGRVSNIKQEAWLSNLLEAGHAGENSPAIRGAIADIQAN